MANNTYTNISDLPTLDNIGENTWVPVEITGKEGKKVDLNSVTPGTLNTDNSTAQAVNANEFLAGTVNLHKVAKTGSYNDLLNKPTIPAAQVNADWNQTDNTQVDFIKNKPDVIPPDGKTIVTSGGKLTVKLGEGLEYSDSKSSIRLNYGTGGPGQLMVENDKVYVNVDSLAGNGLSANNNELTINFDNNSIGLNEDNQLEIKNFNSIQNTQVLVKSNNGELSGVYLDGTGGLSFGKGCVYVDVDNQTLEHASNGTLRLKNFNEYIETGAVPIYDGTDIEWKKIPEALYDTDTANAGDILTFDGDDVVWSATSELSTNESTLDITDSVLSFDTSEASNGSVLTYVGDSEVSWQPCNPKLDLESIDSSGGTDFSSIQIAGYKNAEIDTIPVKTTGNLDTTPNIKWLPFVKSSYIRAKTASVNDRFKFHLEVVIDDIDDGNNPHEWHFEWVEDV